MIMLANATAAANAVIQSVALRRGDLLMMTNLTYPAVSPFITSAYPVNCPVTVLVGFSVPVTAPCSIDLQQGWSSACMCH